MPSKGTRLFLFLSSYSLLLVIIGVQRFREDPEWISPVLVSMAVLSIVVLFIFFKAATRSLAPYTAVIQEARSRDSEVASYLVTYLLPFLGFSPRTWQDLLALGLLTSAIGVLYVTSGMLYVNPILKIAGYRIFEVVLEDGNR